MVCTSNLQLRQKKAVQDTEKTVTKAARFTDI